MEIITCAKCEKETYSHLENCPHCDAPLIEANIDWNKRAEAAKTSGDWSDIPTRIIAEKAGDIILTTSIGVANKEIEREIEIITAECVYGMNFFRDVFSAVRDIFGGRSAATQKVLRDARKTCLTELRREALMIRADAVIAVNLAYQELSGGGKSGLLMLVASGTAVKLKGD